MATEKLVRASGIALMLGGIAIASFVILLWPVGGFFGPDRAQHPLWVPAHLLHFVGALFALFGLVGLYADQARKIGKLGLIGFTLAFAGTACFVGTGLLTAFLWPFLATHAPHTLGPDGALFSLPAATIFFLTTLSLISGYLLFGLALLRSGTGPRGATLLMMAGIVPAMAPPEPVGPLPWGTLVLGGVSFGAGLAWWGMHLWATTTVPSALDRLGAETMGAAAAASGGRAARG